MTFDAPLTSPHGPLQAVLSQLGTLSPRRLVPPLWSDRDAAEHVIAISSVAASTDVSVAAVWSIEHEDLAESHIVGWTVAVVD